MMSPVKTSSGRTVYVSIQQIKVTLQKRVRFRLDGLPPAEGEKKRLSIKDFTPPQLPSPNQKTSYKKKVLKIEKLVSIVTSCCIHKEEDVIHDISLIWFYF